jgi:two-component sensor histidine kinase
MKLFIVILCFAATAHLPVTAQSVDLLIAGLQTDKQKADTIFSFARKVFRKAKFDSADYWLSRGYSFAKNTGDAETMARYNIEWANSQYMQGQFAKGLPYIYTALPLLKQTDSYDLNNSALLIAGNCHSGLQKTDSALKYFFDCADYNNKKFPYRNWLPFTAIADVFLHTENYIESEKYYRKAYELSVAKEEKPDHGYVLTMFANLYYVWQKPDEFAKMIEEYNQLLAARKIKDGKDPAHNLMMIQWQTDKLEERVGFITKVKEASLNSGALLTTILTNSYLINLYEKNKQYAEALKYAEENETLSVKNKNTYNEYVSNKVKYGLYKKMNNHAEAEKTADKLFLLKDSMMRMQRRDVAMELESKYESDKKQKEIALLQAQGKLDAIAITSETEKRKALFKENELKQAAIVEQQKNYVLLARQSILKDSIVESEQAYNGLLQSENSLKQSQLAKEQQLKEALARENNLQNSRLSKEKQTRWLLTGGIGLLLLSGIAIFALYQKQKKKTAIIQKQSADLEVLMKEIHHRVKNNLQVVSSLLDLQSHTITDSQASAAVKEGKNRVQSMALIHQNLYSEGNIKGIMVKEYIGNLVQSLCDSYNITSDTVKVNANIDDLNLDVDTMIPLGLVLNELVSNSFKYAFKENHRGILNIELQEKNEKLHLKVSDNGSGFPADVDVKSAKSFGLKMIKAFAQKLKATLDIYNNNGAVVEMEISKFKAA